MAAVSEREFRDVAGRFATGVTVVGVPGPHAVTVNSFTSVSLDPALVLVCLRTGGRGAAALAGAEVFSVNILAADQAALGLRFAATDRADALDGVAHRPGATGAPLLDGAAAWLECRRAGRHAAGDHTIFLGEVVGLAARPDSSPLVFHRGAFTALSA